MAKTNEMVQRCESFYIGSCKVLDMKACSECKQNTLKYQRIAPKKAVIITVSL
jgi:hypothetical protein